MYTVKNFRTKKALKEAIANGERIGVYQPGPFGDNSGQRAGEVVYLEGPHYPQPHSWYAQGVIGKDGCLDKVK